MIRCSYIDYIALLCMYHAFVILFFPETPGLTIEELSLIFDTGRPGNATAATAELQQHAEDSKRRRMRNAAPPSCTSRTTKA